MKLIKQERRKREISQKQFAQKIGVSLVSYRNWETKKHIPKINHIEAMLQELGQAITLKEVEVTQ